MDCGLWTAHLLELWSKGYGLYLYWGCGLQTVSYASMEVCGTWVIVVTVCRSLFLFGRLLLELGQGILDM